MAAASSAQHRRLRAFSEKRVAQSIKENLSVYCSPHDLIAIVTNDSDVIVYRINGQIAFTIKRKDPDLEVTAVQWKPSGSHIAVGWSDGTYAIHSGENGRLLSRDTVRKTREEHDLDLDSVSDFPHHRDEEEGPVPCMFSWVAHPPALSKQKGSKQSPNDQDEVRKAKDGSLTFILAGQITRAAARCAFAIGPSNPPGNAFSGKNADRYLLQESGPELGDVLAELPRAVTSLDVTKVLARLSAITPHGLRPGPDGGKFATQAAVDSVFEAQRDSISGTVDTLLVCSDDGTMQVLLDDTVHIGSCNIGLKPAVHAGPLTSEHALFTTSDGSSETLVLDLPLETLGSSLLHVVARDTKRIQSLLAYVTQTVRCISHDCTTGLAFPVRLINNINAELSEKSEGDLVHNLYHLAMTGDFTPTMLEWLVDIVKETNHKRWDQAVGGMYTHIQNHAFVNLLPALDRMSIAVTSLRGHARLYEGSSAFEPPAECFTSILESIDALRLVAQKVQLTCMREYQQFRAFSKWLRLQIEIGVAGPFSKNAVESEERGVPELDYGLVLDYIKDTLTNSTLLTYVQHSETLNRQHTPAIADGMPTITIALAGRVRLAMEHITQWQSKLLPPPRLVTLTPEMQNTIDCRDCIELRQSDSGCMLVKVTRSMLLYEQHGSQQEQEQVLHSFPAEEAFVPEKILIGGRMGKRVCVVFGNRFREWRVLDLEDNGALSSNTFDSLWEDEDVDMS